LLAALAFLAEVGREDELVLLSDVLGLSRLVDDATHRRQAGTPSNVLGPFYRPDAPWIANPGSIASESSAGWSVVLAGRVSDAADGRPLADAVVDVWQADGEGRYSMPDDGAKAWDLRGRQRVDGAGRFEVATVVPGDYTIKHDGPVGRLLDVLERHPWRPAHIHLLVASPGHETLTTQAYIAGSAYLGDDAIGGVKDDLVVPVEGGRVTFDVALDRAPG
jgi:protocatechuate 3,4-dioxygenase beta subunit